MGGGVCARAVLWDTRGGVVSWSPMDGVRGSNHLVRVCCSKPLQQLYKAFVGFTYSPSR